LRACWQPALGGHLQRPAGGLPTHRRLPARYVVTSSIDGLSLLRRDLGGQADAADLKREVYDGKGLLRRSAA